jgi:hypothetical protein
MYGEIVELLSIALKVYQLQPQKKKEQRRFAFMSHAAKVCNESMTYQMSLCRFLSPKLDQLQTGKIVWIKPS